MKKTFLEASTIYRFTDVASEGTRMKLQEFVKESLLQVINGVKEANESLDDNRGSVNPAGRGPPNGRTVGGVPLQDVEFDIAVLVSEGSDMGGGLTVMGIGGKGSISETNSSVSRIKFQVPVALPRGNS